MLAHLPGRQRIAENKHKSALATWNSYTQNDKLNIELRRQKKLDTHEFQFDFSGKRKR
jgi:hypothetical protein